jgi:hypothetical protein
MNNLCGWPLVQVPRDDFGDFKGVKGGKRFTPADSFCIRKSESKLRGLWVILMFLRPALRAVRVPRLRDKKAVFKEEFL